jgi:flagellar hook-associated protein 2
MATTSSVGVIQVGGLATGLDTNNIIDQLVALEQRPITLLQQQQSDVAATQTSFGTLRTKLSALQSAADALNTLGEVLVGTAASSDPTVVTVAAGQGAARGTVTIDVSQLARGSVAGASTGVSSAGSTIATGDGVFSFQVGSGQVQSVNVTAGTTLQDLANAINGLGAGVVASAVNLGTDASPDYRLNLVSRATGASSTITVLQDDTTLAVQTTQSGQNARFTVSGFSGTFERESNTFSDVLTGVTFSLRDQGTATVTVEDDPAAITAKVQTLVGAFNDVINFVAGESTVQQGSTSDTLNIGSLAVNSTVRGLVDQLHAAFSVTLAGATTRYVNLSSVGFATQKDGTIAGSPTGSRSWWPTSPGSVVRCRSTSRASPTRSRSCRTRSTTASAGSTTSGPTSRRSSPRWRPW